MLSVYSWLYVTYVLPIFVCYLPFITCVMCVICGALFAHVWLYVYLCWYMYIPHCSSGVAHDCKLLTAYHVWLMLVHYSGLLICCSWLITLFTPHYVSILFVHNLLLIMCEFSTAFYVSYFKHQWLLVVVEGLFSNTLSH